MNVLVHAALVWAALSAARTALPDARHLAWLADSAGVPVEVVWAVAWEETRGNLNPRVRGKHGEIGRFQIKPATARARCPGLNIRTYSGNTRCFVRMLKEDGTRYGYRTAIRIHNGSGPEARAYRDRVLATAHTFHLGERP